MKKGVKVLGLIILGLVFTSMFAGFVSAAPQGSLTDLVKSFVNGILDISKTFLNPLLGGTPGDTGPEMMAKILFFFILLSLVYTVLKRSLNQFFGANEWALWIISIAVPVLGVRLLSKEFIYAMILSNEAFAVTAISLIPFALMFFMTLDWHSFARRTAWILYAVVFFALYISRATGTSPEIAGMAALIYPTVALIALMMAFADGTIERIKNKWRISQADEERKNAVIMQIQLQIEQVERASNNGTKTTYRGTTRAGRGKIGMDAYLADIAFYNAQIANVR